MKKILFASTALLAAGAFASSAQASDPIKLSVGGYMKQWVAAGSQDGDYDDANRTNSTTVGTDAEIHFKGSTTLDNGMKIAVRAELETNGNSTAAAGTDEVYMDLSGKYGALRIGSDDNAAARMAIMAPSVSQLFTAGDGSMLEGHLPTGDAVTLEVAENLTGDVRKVTYMTPKMFGLQAGVSYVSSEAESDGAGSSITIDNAYDDAWAFGLNYSADFDGVGVDAGVGYQLVDDSDSTFAKAVQTGLNVSFMGFTVGAGATFLNDDDAEEEGYAYNVGVSYKEGPYGVSAVYYASEAEGTVGDSVEDEVQEYQLAGTYALGKGVMLFGEIDYVNAETGLSTETGNEGAIGGAVGLKLSF